MSPAPHLPPTPGVLDKLQRHTLMKVLKRVPALLEDLEITITRTDALRPQSLGSSGHKERVVPFNQRASDARVELEKAVREYALRVAMVNRVPAPHGAEAQSRFLREQLPRIPDDAQSIHGIFTKIVGAHDAARRAIDRPVDRSYSGTCDCGSRLYAAQGAPIVKCHACGLRWDAQERREWLLDQAKDTYGTAAELARLLPWFDGRPVQSKTITKWGERGMLRRYTLGGRIVFRIGDVLALHRASTPASQPLDRVA